MSYSINKKDVEVISLLVARISKYIKSDLITVDELFKSINDKEKRKLYEVLDYLFENPNYKLDFFILKDSFGKFYVTI